MTGSVRSLLLDRKNEMLWSVISEFQWQVNVIDLIDFGSRRVCRKVCPRVSVTCICGDNMGLNYHIVGM